MICPHSSEKVCGVPEINKQTARDIEMWLYVNPGRSETFQAFLDSLDTRAVRRAKVKPERPVLGNYATKR